MERFKARVCLEYEVEAESEEDVLEAVLREIEEKGSCVEDEFWTNMEVIKVEEG